MVSLHAASDFALFKLYTAAVSTEVNIQMAHCRPRNIRLFDLAEVSTLAVPGELDGRTTAVFL